MINPHTPCSPTVKAMQNAEIGMVLGVMGHPRSLTMSPFDKVHMTS